MQESHRLIQPIARRFASANPAQRAARQSRGAPKRDRAASASAREKPEKSTPIARRRGTVAA
jgi:hypothetical protein